MVDLCNFHAYTIKAIEGRIMTPLGNGNSDKIEKTMALLCRFFPDFANGAGPFDLKNESAMMLLPFPNGVNKANLYSDL